MLPVARAENAWARGGLASERPIVFWQRQAAATAELPPDPKYRTPLGMLAAFRDDPLGFFMATFRIFGDVVGLYSWPGPIKSFFIAHPDHIKHVLQDHNQRYCKGIVIAKLKVLIGPSASRGRTQPTR